MKRFILLMGSLMMISGCLSLSDLLFEIRGDQICLTQGSRTLWTRDHVEVRTPDGNTAVFPLKLEGNVLIAHLGQFGTFQEALDSERGIIRGRISLDVNTDDPFLVRCPFSMPKPDEQPYFMIPCFLYGSNALATSTGRQPKLDYGKPPGIPNGGAFSTRADRSSHPGVITVVDGRVCLIGIREVMEGVDEDQRDPWKSRFVNTGLFVETSDPAEDRVGFTLGYRHDPYRYTGKTHNPDSPKQDEYRFGWIRNQKGKTLTVRTFYFADLAERIPDHARAIRAYYEELHEAPRKRAGRGEAMEKIGQAQLEDAWNSRYKYFRVTDWGEPGEGDIAWTGGMQNAWPLIQAGLKINRQDFVDTASVYIDYLVNHGMNEKAGLFYEAKQGDDWKVAGWWHGNMGFGNNPKHSAYLNGQASYYILKSWEALGGEKSHWLETAKRVIETAIRSQRADGAYPCLFDAQTGEGANYTGFQSCWFVPGAAMLYKITGESRYLESARQALSWYHGFHEQGELYGTPMDTHGAVDEEGNLAFISACAELHKITRDAEILKMGEDALNWEWTWKFAYNTVHSNEPLRSLLWSSCGGSVTSTHNVHIHQMNNLVVDDMYYLYQQLGEDAYIASRIKDTCIWGLGTFNRFDKEFGFGETGWGTEQFFHSDGLQDMNGPWDGGIWYGHLAWATSCVMAACASDVPDEFFGE